METNRFDQQFKEKLDKRIIEPSSGAWDVLSKRLDEQAKRKSGKNYWWLGLAASLVGVVLFATQFGVSDVNVTNTPSQVVETPHNTLDADDMKTEEQYNFEKKTDDNSKRLIADENEAIQDTDIKESLAVSNLDKVAVDFDEEQTATLKNDDAKMELPKDKSTFEEQKIQDIVAEVQLLNDKHIEVTEADLDALLIKAQKEIALNRLHKETGSVDAYALLESVELELDQSFRNKVLEAIKASYDSVKTAIAQRNE